MDRKHLYFHSSNLKSISDINKDENFEPAFHYKDVKTHPNEFGRIKTRQNYYHLLIGNLRQKGCAWCKSELKIIKTNYPPTMVGGIAIVLQCIKCGSRGPIWEMNESLEGHEESMEIIKDRMEEMYMQRKPWHDDLDER